MRLGRPYHVALGTFRRVDDRRQAR